jgi:hypothetical protein
MNEELARWERIKLECEKSIDTHGAIIEAVTDRGKPVLRKNPAIETLQKATLEIEKLRKTLSDGLNLD